MKAPEFQKVVQRMQQRSNWFAISLIAMSTSAGIVIGVMLGPWAMPIGVVGAVIGEGDTVLDFTCGSGTTGVACVIEKRNAVLIEQDAGYCEVSAARIKRAQGIACDVPKRIKQYAPTPLFEAVA